MAIRYIGQVTPRKYTGYRPDRKQMVSESSASETYADGNDANPFEDAKQNSEKERRGRSLACRPTAAVVFGLAPADEREEAESLWLYLDRDVEVLVSMSVDLSRRSIFD